MELSEESQEIYEGPILGRDYFDLDIARLRYLGGTSNHWGGWCRPLDASGFLRPPRRRRCWLADRPRRPRSLPGAGLRHPRNRALPRERDPAGLLRRAAGGLVPLQRGAVQGQVRRLPGGGRAAERPDQRQSDRHNASWRRWRRWRTRRKSPPSASGPTAATGLSRRRRATMSSRSAPSRTPAPSSTPTASGPRASATTTAWSGATSWSTPTSTSAISCSTDPTCWPRAGDSGRRRPGCSRRRPSPTAAFAWCRPKARARRVCAGWRATS